MRNPSEGEGALAHGQQDPICCTGIEYQGRGKVMPHPQARGGILKIDLSIPPELVNAIVDDVVARLKPILTGLQTNPSQSDDLMGVGELGKYLGGVSRDWIYQRTAGNEIPFVKVGRMIKFRRCEIDRWLVKQSTPAIIPLSAPLPPRRPRDCESRDTGKTPCVIDKV